MKFLDKLRDKINPFFDKNERIRIAQAGERMEAFVESGAYDAFNDEILAPMESEAFEVLKRVSPTEIADIIQAQKMAQIVSEIRRRLEKKILVGIETRRQILNDSTQQEGEQ